MKDTQLLETVLNRCAIKIECSDVIATHFLSQKAKLLQTKLCGAQIQIFCAGDEMDYLSQVPNNT
jgi:hypothetical protein